MKALLLICSEYSLEEVLLAEDLAISSETLVAQLSTALAALEALGVPRAVQHLQDEAVQNQLLTAPALGDAGCNTTGRHTIQNASFLCYKSFRIPCIKPS
jgi:hypothetical protein